MFLTFIQLTPDLIGFNIYPNWERRYPLLVRINIYVVGMSLWSWQTNILPENKKEKPPTEYMFHTKFTQRQYPRTNESYQWLVCAGYLQYGPSRVPIHTPIPQVFTSKNQLPSRTRMANAKSTPCLILRIPFHWADFPRETSQPKHQPHDLTAKTNLGVHKTLPGKTGRTSR